MVGYFALDGDMTFFPPPDRASDVVYPPSFVKIFFGMSVFSWPFAVPLFLAFKFFNRCYLWLHLLVGALWGLGFALLLGAWHFEVTACGALWALLFWLVVYGSWPRRQALQSAESNRS
jgi:hypothetical protein